MFTSARIKLTGWYLLIIILISGSFSAIIYSLINRELIQIEENQRARWERQVLRYLPVWEAYKAQQQLQGLPIPELPEELEQPDFTSVEIARGRVQRFLLFVNLAILGGAGFAGFFLAGRTLKPIKEMVEEQDRFISDSSHELRTPLTSLRSELEVNLMDRNLNLSSAKKLLKSNLEDVIHLQNLAENLMKITRYSRKQNHMTFERVFLNEVVTEACKKVAGLAKAKRINIINNTNKIELEVEKMSFTELLIILIDNAIKYSPPKTTITIASRTVSRSIHISVSDQGVGIDKNDLPHLFDRFYRSEYSRNKEKADGFGLGLTIAKQIVERHSGTISVKSKRSEGSTFTITLPQKQ